MAFQMTIRPTEADYAAAEALAAKQPPAASTPADPWAEFKDASPAPPTATATQGGPAPADPWSEFKDAPAEPDKHADPGALVTGLSHLAQGATANFSDEILAGIKSGFGFLNPYDEALQHERDILQGGSEHHPIIAGAGDIVGALGTLAIPGVGELGAVARGAGLGAKVAAGARVGAAYGAASGAGAADGGIGDRVGGAVEGGLLGAATGGALPVALQAGRNALQPIASAVTSRLNPEGFAAGKVAERVGNLDQAGNRMQRAADNGQNMALADVGGDSARTLLRTAANVPGPAKGEISAKVNIAALGQGDRLRRIVDATLANPNGYQDAKAAVMDARSHAATPYYNFAYSRPVPFTHEIESVLQTPAGRAGLAAARTNALNRREPWAQWFANVADDGSIIDIRNVPDTRALDEVQRVMAVQERSAMRPADGSPFARMIDTPASIAIRNAHQSLLREVDRLNPAFARARAVGLDNIQADEALEFGRNALKNDARVNARRMGQGGEGRDRVFTPGQQELARVGAAEAIRAKIDSAGWTHNAILRFFKSSEDARRIRPLFADNEDWLTFQRAIFNEARRAKTVNAVRGNSTTAGQLADMADAGNAAGDVVRNGLSLARGNVGELAVNAVVNGLRRLGGFTPQVAQHVGRMLLSRDPQEVARIIGRIRQIETQRLDRGETANQIRRLLTTFAASQEGRALGSQQNELAVAR